MHWNVNSRQSVGGLQDMLDWLQVATSDGEDEGRKFGEEGKHILSNVFVWTKAPAAESDSDTEVAEDGSETEVEEEEDDEDKGQGEGSD